jgi:hypothetical protein
MIQRGVATLMTLATLLTAAACATDAANDGQERGIAVTIVTKTPPEPEPSADPSATAATFAHAWTRHDLSQDQWWALLLPLCTHQYAPLIRTQQLGDVPARRVTSPPRAVATHQQSTTYVVETDAGSLHITLIPQDGRWKVLTSRLYPPGATPEQPVTGPTEGR